MALPGSHMDEKIAPGCSMDQVLTFESGSPSTSSYPTTCGQGRAAKRHSRRGQRNLSAPIPRQSDARLGPELPEYNEQQQKYRDDATYRSLSRRVLSESDHHHLWQPFASNHPPSLSFLGEDISVGKTPVLPDIIVSSSAASEGFNSNGLPSTEVVNTPDLKATRRSLIFSSSATDFNTHPSRQSILRASHSISNPEGQCAALEQELFPTGSLSRRATQSEPPGSSHAAGLASSSLPSFESGLRDRVLAVGKPTVSRNDMAASIQRMSGEGRRYPSSGQFNNRYENQRPMNNLLCRNGPQCIKNQEGKCNYNHDFSNINQANGLSRSVVSRNTHILNVC